MPTADDTTRSVIAIAAGDSCGIGPEVIPKTLAHDDVFALSRPLVVGDMRVLRRAPGWQPDVDLALHSVGAPDEGRHVAGAADVFDLHDADPAKCPVGQVSAAAGALTWAAAVWWPPPVGPSVARGSTCSAKRRRTSRWG